MADLIQFFQQYEPVIYALLWVGVIAYGWRFYQAWQEMRGSVFGLEQVGAQRRLNRSAVAIFAIILLGVGVFGMVTFAEPIIETADQAAEMILPDAASDQAGGGTMDDSESPLATATPLPTVEVDPAGCVADEILITSPQPNTEIRGVIEVTGVVNVEDFGFYMFEIARAEEALWMPIQANRAPAPEETTLLEWDSSLFPPGSYVLQLVVTTNDGEEYPPCRIPIRIGAP
jgi:hypothetical protein